MNVSAGSLTTVGPVKIPGHGTTAPGPAGAKGIGSGFAVALSDGRTPGKVSPADEFVPVMGKVVDEGFPGPGSKFNISA
jgi:hypothetical protein